MHSDVNWLNVLVFTLAVIGLSYACKRLVSEIKRGMSTEDEVDDSKARFEAMEMDESEDTRVTLKLKKMV